MDHFPFDDDYVRRLRDGDRFTEEHFSSYFPPSLRIMLRRQGTPSDAIEDVIQDTLFRVLKNVRADKIRDGRTFGKYVKTVCKNTAQEDFRKGRNTDQLGDTDDRPDPDTPQRKFMKRELQGAVRAVLAEMDERDATILDELYLQELDKDEICRRHGIDRNYLRVLLHRAREKFRKLFDDDSFLPPN